MGGGMPSDAGLRWFEQEYRDRLESRFAFADLDGESGDLGYGASDRATFFEALQAYYPTGHWLNEAKNYPTIDDIALQVMLAAACRLRPEGLDVADHFLDNCVRVVRSPALSPYAILPQRIIVIPRGFLHSIGTFLSTVFEIGFVGAKFADPGVTIDLWRPDQIIAAQDQLMIREPHAYRYAIFVALQPTMMTQVVADFSDGLRAALFKETLNRGLQQMMPASSRFGELGVGALGSILPLQPALQRANLGLRRLVVCVAIAHELGHLFVGGVAKSMEDGPDRAEAEGVFHDEGLADTFGMLILYRLKETGFLNLLVHGRPVTNADFINAIAAFNAWNLSICIARLLVAEFDDSIRGREEAMATLTQVASRWQTSTDILIKADGGGGKDEQESSFAATICSSWADPCAEMLSILLKAKGVALDRERAFAALYHLGDPQSKLHAFLAGQSTEVR
jgi:hypothetical protein